MQRWAVIGVLYLFTSGSVSAQNIDSLRTALNRAKHRDERVLTALRLSSAFQRTDKDSSFKYVNHAITLSDAPDLRALNIYAKIRLAETHARFGDNPLVIETIRTTLNQYQQSGDSDTLIAHACWQLGLAYYHLAEYDSALSNLFHSLKIFENLPRAETQEVYMAQLLNNIGNVYYFTNRDQAIQYYSRSLSIYQKWNLTVGMASQYGNLGLLYIQRDDTLKALDYSKRALDLHLKKGSERSIATSHINLALAYKEFGQFENALLHAQRSLEIRNQINDPKGIALSTVMLGNIYYDSGKLEQAIAMLKTGLVMVHDLKLRNYELEVLTTLAEAHSKLKKYKEAAQYYPKALGLRDSIYRDESAELMAKMEGLYQSQKDGQVKLLTKEAEVAELNLKKRETYLLAAAGITFLLSVISFILFLFYRSRTKANAELEKKNNEVERQKAVVDARNDEIMQSFNYARRLQEAVMPGEAALKGLFSDSFLLYRPRDVVSGDFYWTTSRNGIIYLAVGDCTGHGVPGAMLSVIGLNSLNRCISDLGLTRPKDVLMQMTIDLLITFEAADAQVRDGMDIALCAIDTRTNTLTFAGANNPLWVARGEEMLVYKGDRRAVGYHDGETVFTQQEVALQQGDAIYLMSDGFQDQLGGPDDRKFMTKKLRETLQSISHLPMAEQHTTLDRTFTQWRADREQTDDVCVVGVRLN